MMPPGFPPLDNLNREKGVVVQAVVMRKNTKQRISNLEEIEKQVVVGVVVDEYSDDGTEKGRKGVDVLLSFIISIWGES
jgi:hypothetical protein